MPIELGADNDLNLLKLVFLNKYNNTSCLCASLLNHLFRDLYNQRRRLAPLFPRSVLLSLRKLKASAAEF